MKKWFLAIALILAAAPAFAQHGIEVQWTQSTGCSSACTITKNSVYRGANSAGPFTQIFTSTAPVTSYLDPLTTANQGAPACYVITAWTTIESAQSSPAACSTFPMQAASATGVSATPQ